MRMLTIAEVSGIIAAAVMIVQYLLPAGLVIILVRYVGNESTAATWSSVNRTISNTVWPLLLQADSVGSRHRALPTVILTWAMTLSAILLALAGVVAPLGLRDEIVPGEVGPVYFQYAKDPTAWGRVTMPRPDRNFGRYCEFGRRINCPGQYQGVDFNETKPGTLQSVQTDSSSTINTTVPANYTKMFSSATSGPGNTLSGLFDIQYRRWELSRVDIIDHGEPRVEGDYRHIETLIPQDDILLKEGLIVDVRDNPGIGFRNHTVPVDLTYGGTWSEDLTWLEPVTSCADTNLTVEIRTVDTVDSFRDNVTVFLVDRGAFRDLDIHALESRIWSDNQTLDLFGRAHKAARMYNVFVANALNVSLPLDPENDTMPELDLQIGSLTNPLGMNELLFSSLHPDIIKIGEIRGIKKDLFGNETTIRPPRGFNPRFEDGERKLFASNFTAIKQICRGYYRLDDSIDRRAANISNPAVACGLLVGGGSSNAAPSKDGRIRQRQNMYICASGIRASVKTVDFRYNGTNGQLGNLKVDRIADKVYPDERSKPLWAVESSEPFRMTFDPLWGMVNDDWETTAGFFTMRSEKLWLPAIADKEGIFGSHTGLDSLAAVSSPAMNTAGPYFLLYEKDQYIDGLLYPLVERFSRLSLNETGASQIPSLMITDSLASLLVGTKTAIRSDPVEYPAKLSSNDPPSGLSRANVVSYRRAIRYDIRYAIPGLVLLFLLALVLLWDAVILLFSHLSIIRVLRDTYNQTSTGRLATTLLSPEPRDPNESSSSWVDEAGRLMLNFGRIANRESDYFLLLKRASATSLLHAETENSPALVDSKHGMTQETTRF